MDEAQDASFMRFALTPSHRSDEPHEVVELVVAVVTFVEDLVGVVHQLGCLLTVLLEEERATHEAECCDILGLVERFRLGDTCQALIEKVFGASDQDDALDLLVVAELGCLSKVCHARIALDGAFEQVVASDKVHRLIGGFDRLCRLAVQAEADRKHLHVAGHLGVGRRVFEGRLIDRDGTREVAVVHVLAGLMLVSLVKNRIGGHGAPFGDRRVDWIGKELTILYQFY